MESSRETIYLRRPIPPILWLPGFLFNLPAGGLIWESADSYVLLFLDFNLTRFIEGVGHITTDQITHVRIGLTHKICDRQRFTSIANRK
jgi:hypothetical protein